MNNQDEVHTAGLDAQFRFFCSDLISLRRRDSHFSVNSPQLSCTEGDMTSQSAGCLQRETWSLHVSMYRF